MPGHFQISCDQLAAELEEAAELGLGGVLLFGIPDEKDALGSDSTSDEGIVQQAIRAAKKAARQLLVITDVCFCEYTDHGHCGVVNERTGRVDVDNDATLELIANQALEPRPGRRRRGRPQRHDGRHGRSDSRAAGRRGLRARADHELRGQVRQRLLWPVSRGGRKRAAVRRSPRLPDGPGGRAPNRRCAKWSSIWPKAPTS